MTPEKPVVPLAKILEWHASHAEELRQWQLDLEMLKESSGELDVDNSNVSYRVGQISVGQAWLDDLAAFAITEAADEAGTLEPPQTS